MSSLQLQNASFDDIVFQGKNKSYGAYDIRQSYPFRIFIATAIAMGIFLLGVGSPFIIDALTPADEVVVDDGPQIVKTELSTVRRLNQEPPPPEIKLPEFKQIQFVAPKVMENVIEDEKTQVLDVEAAEEAPTGTTSNEATDVGNIDLGQQVETQKIIEEAPQVLNFVNVEQKPEFPGGDAAFQKYLVNNISYTSQAQELQIQGRVMVSFAVATDGSIVDVKVVKGLAGGLDEVALKAIKNMPKWTPGKQNGRPVIVKHTLPVNFRLN